MMNYYPHHIGDFRSGTFNMTRHERWIYRDMMDVYYDREGPFPDSLDAICKIIGVRCAEEKEMVAAILLLKFELRDTGYHNDRCDMEIAAYRAKAETAKSNGKKSAERRYQNGEYMPLEGTLYAVRFSPGMVKIGVSGNIKSRLSQLRGKYGKHAYVVHQVPVSHMGDAESDLLNVYAGIRSGDEIPVDEECEAQLVSHMNRIMVAYQVAYQVASPSHTNQEPITNNHKPEDQKQGASAPDQAFERAFAAYPKRHGGNSKPDALKSWNARIAERVDPADMIAGTERFAENMRVAGKVGTEFVMQAVRFYGKARHYAEPWASEPPPSARGPSKAAAAMGSNAQDFEDPFARRHA